MAGSMIALSSTIPNWIECKYAQLNIAYVQSLAELLKYIDILATRSQDIDPWITLVQSSWLVQRDLALLYIAGRRWKWLGRSEFDPQV